MSHDIFFDEQEHIYLVDGIEVPSVTTILQPLSQRAYASVNPSVLEYARNRGTAVHEVLELLDYGAEPDISPEIVPYINAYMEWQSIYKPKWEGVEQIVYSENYGFIGTLDRIGVLNGVERAIVDIKTSHPTKEALVSVCLQTAAYDVAYCEQNGITGQYNKETAISRYGLFLKSDGSFRFQKCQDYEVKYNFNAYHNFHELLKINKAITELLKTGKEKDKE